MSLFFVRTVVIPRESIEKFLRDNMIKAYHQTTCIECGINIVMKRNDAKYCSDRCRMRSGRKQKKVRLIAKLFNVCTNIPNHTLKSTDGQSSVRILNAKNNSYDIYTLKVLYSLNFQQIEALIEQKKREVKAYNLIQPLLKSRT